MKLLPEQQKAIVITAAGGPEILQARTVPVPQTSDSEVLIEVQAAGVNRHDCGQRRRGPVPQHSDIPGLEVAGIVRAVGSRVTGFSIGDRVCALVDGGGYAEYAVAPASHAFHLDSALSMTDGAALPEALFTTWHNFFNVAQLRAGETALIHGGTSGVGTIAIQLLTALGHPVFATCGSDEKCELAHSLGAARAFNYGTEDFVASVLQHTGGQGVDVILDMAGGRYSARNIEALARRGRLVHLSPGDGADFCAPLRAIMAKEAKVTGSLLRPLPACEKSLIADELRKRAWPMIREGKVKPVVRKVLPLAQAGQAHALLESGQMAGKIILDCKTGLETERETERETGRE